MPKVIKSNYRPYFDIDIDKSYSPEDRRAIAQEIIDEIVARTENGLDADGKPFVGYSKSYTELKGQSNVDLTFSGDMLAEIKLLQEKSGKIRIGFESSYDGLGKVEGNILGTYGNKNPINKGRNFLGIPKEDLDRILSQYETQQDTQLAQEVSRVARRITRQSQVENPEDEG